MNQDFAAAISRFCADVRMRTSQSETEKHYMSDLKQFGRVIDKAPDEIGRGEITNFVTAQLEASMSGTTVNRRLATLSRFFDYLADESGDESWSNPVVWRLHRVATGHHLPRDVPERLIRQLWGSISQGPPRDQAIFALMLDVGLRVGEVSKLTQENVEVAATQDELWALRVCGKGQKERCVWLTPETAAQLSTYLDVRPDAADTHLFLTRRHKGISVRGIQERLDHYRQQAGLTTDVVSCHRLRHTFARRMAEARMPLPSLSHWLGHSQLKTTQLYIDGANPDIRADYEAAMDQLSPHAECPDISTDAPLPEMALARVDAAPTAESEIRLSGDEMRQKLEGMPAWVQDLIVAFLLHQQLRWKAQYRRRRTQQWLGELRRSWQWMLDQRPMTALSALTRGDVQAYLSHLHDMEHSTHTINHFINTFKSFLHFADTTGATIAPALYRIQRLKRTPSLPRPLSPQAFARLEQTVLTTDSSDAPTRLLDRTWFLILADTGLRIGELEALIVADWDPHAHSLLIRNAKHYRDRRLPVTQRTADVINSYLGQRTDDFGPHHPLLVCQGRPLQAGYVRNHLHDFAALAQIDRVTPHRLRHTFATRLLNSGHMPITTLQKLMGHTHIDTTMVYVQLYDETIQQHYLAAMATYSLHDIPEPDPTIWGPTLEHAFDATLHNHKQLP